MLSPKNKNGDVVPKEQGRGCYPQRTRTGTLSPKSKSGDVCYAKTHAEQGQSTFHWTRQSSLHLDPVSASAENPVPADSAPTARNARH